jgi:hypothetical protein
LSGFEKVSKVLMAARAALGDTLTAFEFVDRNALAVVRRANPHLLHRYFPLAAAAAAAVVVIVVVVCSCC